MIRTGSPEQVVQGVGVVDPKLHEGPARALLPEVAPLIRGELKARARAPEGLGLEGPAHRAVLDERLHLPVARRPAVAVPHREDLSRRAPGREDGPRLGQGVRDRLLHPDVLPGPEGGLDLRPVDAVRRGDQDALDGGIGQDGLIAPGLGTAVRLREGGALLGGAGVAGNEVELGALLGRPPDRPRPPADPHQGDLHGLE